MSLSERIPNARKRMKSGTDFLTLGTLTTIFLFDIFALGATIFTDNVRIGLDTFSETERIVAVYRYISSESFFTSNILSANFS